MAQYEPKRLNTLLPNPTARHRPRRLRRGDPAPKRLASPHRPPAVRLLLLTAALTAAAILGGTTARYWKAWSNDSLATAGSFYFTSDKLDGTDGAEGSLYRLLPDGEGKTAEFSFALKNYVVADYYTKNDISYTCTVTNSEGTPVAAAWSDGVAAGGERTLKGDGNQNPTLTCTIPVSAFGTDGSKVLTVTARAAKPYSAALTARVALIVERGGITMVVTDSGGNSGAVAVTFYNTSQKNYRIEGFKLKSGSELLLAQESENKDLILAADPTWEIKAAPDGTLKVPGGEAMTVVFLKKSTENRFSESSFEFTCSEYSEVSG